jgi:triosephosphate isomerase (TIM)
MKLFIANWKMNLSVGEGLKYLKALKLSRNEVAIAAPFTFLGELNKIATKKKIKLAGQNVSQFETGAYTGEISANMLKEVGCSYCLVGHSERRIYFQETDDMINQKVKMLLKNKIKSVICLGENAGQRASGFTNKVIKSQLDSALTGIKDPVGLIIAYEPVWAISTFQQGKNVKSASSEDIVEAHKYIRSLLVAKYGSRNKQVRIIYGGTVTAQNSRDILKLQGVDGALVGGASLKVSSFNDIIQNT